MNRILLAFAFLSVTSTLVAQSSDIESIKREFIEESQAANDEYRKALANVALDYTSKRNVNSRETVETATNFSNSPFQLLKSKFENEDFDTVFMMNPDYTASLKKTGEEFILQDISSLQEDNPFANRVGFGDRFCCQFGQFGDYEDDRHISQLLESGDLVITDARRNEDETLSIEFTWNVPEKVEMTGHLTVNPKRYWTIEKLETSGTVNGRNSTFRLVAKYNHEPVRGVVPPSYHEEETRFIESGVVDHKKNDYKFYIPNPAPTENEFRVSHYKIPEPEWASKPRSNRLAIWLFVGVGVLVSAGLFMRRSSNS